MSDITLYVSVLGPSGSGKSSLLTSIFEETKKRLSGNATRIKFESKNEKTNALICDSINKLHRAIADSPDKVRLQPQDGTGDIPLRFDFTLTSRGKASVDFSIVDYCGGWLGTSKFEEVAEFFELSEVVLVPIPTDLLLEMKKLGPSSKYYVALKNSLDIFNVITALDDWISYRKNCGGTIIFSPIRCEHCFTDNINSEKIEGIIADLHEAVKEYYISALAEIPNNFDVKIHAVDTMGGVVHSKVNYSMSKNNIPIASSDFTILGEALKDKTVKLFQKQAFELLMLIMKQCLLREKYNADTAKANAQKQISSETIFTRWRHIFKTKEKITIMQSEAIIQKVSDALEPLNDMYHGSYDRERTKRQILEGE